jgi:hypothetical protein
MPTSTTDHHNYTSEWKKSLVQELSSNYVRHEKDTEKYFSPLTSFEQFFSNLLLTHQKNSTHVAAKKLLPVSILFHLKLWVLLLSS